MRRFDLLASVLALVSSVPALAQEVIFIEGEVPEGPETHFFEPFEVPEGIAEIEVVHVSLTEGNILDFGLDDPNGFRGWGGGNTERAVVGESAASRSYVPGPIPAGTWRVVVGKAKISESPAHYELEITLRDSPVLDPQPERRAYSPPEPLELGRRWYAGDFHVHSRESGDATATLDEIADLARSRGLDFVVITDHNTHTGADFFADAQERHPDVLFVPGVEFTTYAGHANAIGATEWVDHRIGVEGATIETAFAGYEEQGAIVSINHPVLDLGDACIGCAWEHDEIVPSSVGAVEIETAEIDTVGFLFVDRALAFWDELLDAGSRAVALGGSDDHRAGVDLGGTQSPIGSPTTMVEADELSVEGILEGLRRGRTSVKMGNPDDPLAYIDVSPSDAGGPVKLTLRVEGATPGQSLVLVRNGVTVDRFTIEEPSASFEVDASSGEDRYRVEVHADVVRAVSSHVFVDSRESGGGCAAASPGGEGLPLALALAALVTARRGRRRPA